MNASTSVKWYIDERINEAYKFVENRRLAREAIGAQPTGTVDRAHLRFMQFIATFLKSGRNLGHVSTEAKVSLTPGK